MGRLFDRFKDIRFKNEAEVSQNFILPLLKEFLGYADSEIIPEKNFPARNLYSGVNFAGGGSKGLTHRPDYVVCIDGVHDNVRFIIDSKGPGENLDEHIGQLKSYANSVGQNFLMITNGLEVRVYDVNHIIFYSKGVDDLQVKIIELLNLLGRENHLLKSSVEILKTFNFDVAIAQSLNYENNQELQKRKILLFDFQDYLNSIQDRFKEWHLPSSNFKGINNLDIRQFDPNYLLNFKYNSRDSNTTKTDDKIFKFAEIESRFNLKKKVFIGETGTGKTSLLKFLTLQTAENASDLIDVKIPVFISLKEIGVGYTLEDLITASLIRYGYKLKSFQDLNLLKSFVFYLDAFDEVGEAFANDVTNAIENLSLHYDCYVTTRPNAIPKLENAIAFDILPLDDKQVEEVVRQYLGSKYYDFQQQVESNDLEVESRNTLLLLFMISLYKDFDYLPDTASKVIRAMVDRIRLWQENRKTINIKWPHLSHVLAELAYCISWNDVASLNRKEADSIILKCILELEQNRYIAVGFTIEEMLIALTETGLIIADDNHIYFWHRLFLNHFSALGLHKRFNQNPELIKQVSDDERWDIIIIAMASHLDDVSELVKNLSDRFWLAAYCLVENKCCRADVTTTIVDDLIQNVSSIVPENRSKAISFLEKTNNQQSQNFLLGTFKKEHYDDVKMMCLSAIAINSSVEAKKIIDQNLDWNTTTFLHWRSSQAHIVKALSHYGEEGYHQIITNWEKYSSFGMSEACKAVFLRLYSTDRLSQSLIQRLQNLYLTELIATDRNIDKIESIADILSFVPQLQFTKLVLSSSFTSTIEYPKQESLVRILRSFPTTDLVDEIVAKIESGSSNNYLIQDFARALYESAAPISKDTYIRLIRHNDIAVACYGLEALGRFPYNDVKSEVESHLYGDQPQLQCRALGLLVDNGKFINLIRQHKFPSSFATPTAHILMEAVRRFHLIEAMPILHDIHDAIVAHKNYIYESHLAFELASTFYFMGDEERQRQVISLYFNGTSFLFNNESYIQTNLIRQIKYFDKQLAYKIADAYYLEHISPIRDNNYLTEAFIKSAEEIGDDWMRNKIKQIADQYIELIKEGVKYAKLSIERPLRALTKIGRTEDESWLLACLPHLEYNAGLRYNQLRRAIECLGTFGTRQSLPVILELSHKMQEIDSILDICQFAYNSICRREKILATETKTILT